MIKGNRQGFLQCRCIDLRYPNKLLTQFIWRLRQCYAHRNDDKVFRQPEINLTDNVIDK